MDLPNTFFRFWTCSMNGCSLPAAIDIGACEHCQKQFCATHVASALHLCDRGPLDDETWDAAQKEELEALHRSVNYESLLRHASSLKGGIACHLDDTDPLGRSRLGGMHVHRRIVFADGSSWLARLPRQNFTSFSDDITNSILRSECATLEWLARIRDMPSPKVHGYGLRNDPQNDVGVAYMLIDEMPGRPLLYLDPTPEQLKKVYSSLAHILCTLGKHPFDKIGSLTYDSNGEICVGHIVGDRTGTLPPLGPFSNAVHYYVNWAQTYLNFIQEKQLFSTYAADAYLIYKYITKLAADGRFNCLEKDLDNGPFFLKHMDDKGDHIMVDEDFNIVGIIDWSFARTVPIYEAFGPSLVTAEMHLIYEGIPGLGDQDKAFQYVLECKSPHLGRFAAAPDLIRRLSFGLGTGMNLEWKEALAVFQGIVKTVDGYSETFGWEKWRNAHLSEFSDDQTLRHLTESTTNRDKHKYNPPRFATCSVTECNKPGVRGASCSMCRRHLCKTHRAKSFHTCPSMSELDDEAWEKTINDEVAALLSKINVSELTKRATSLNGGKYCKFQPGKHLGSNSLMGCANYHGILIFDDGEEWLVRIPRTGFSDVPMDLVEYLVASEYATLNFLESTTLPCPKVFGYGLASDTNNTVGVNYILMEKLPGKPYYQHLATPEQQSRVLSQVADYMIELSNYPFSRAGSLVSTDENFKVGPVASNRFISLGKYGPFDTAVDYFTSIADEYLDLIADGQLYDEYPKEAFLFYKLLHRHAADLCCNETQGAFYLKHVDDKGDHLLIDDEHNVTGIIDWQFARVVPACEAFGPSLITADLSALYSAKASLSEDDKMLFKALKDKGREDLARYTGDLDPVRRFHLGLASGFGRNEACELIQGMLVSLGEEPVDIDVWIENESKNCHDDHRWKLVFPDTK